MLGEVAGSFRTLEGQSGWRQDDGLVRAYSHISRHPATGSPRYAHELNLPGLRTRALTRCSYLAFYVERSDHIDVWRVLHGQRSIPAWMQEMEFNATMKGRQCKTG